MFIYSLIPFWELYSKENAFKGMRKKFIAQF